MWIETSKNDPLLQNLETFCSFPHRHGKAKGKLKDSRQDIWEGASKQAFRARLRPIFTFARLKLDVFLPVFSFSTSTFATSTSMFPARLPPNFNTSHNRHACQGICTLSPLRADMTMQVAENTQHDTSEVVRLPRKSSWTRPKCCACHLPRKMQLMF